MDITREFITSAVFEFKRYKTLGDKTLDQLSEAQLHWKNTETDNSVAIIIKHIAGNMLSRWTNFLTEDGEKAWRDRETEFENPPRSKEELLLIWNKGWNCLFDALDAIDSTNFQQEILIRGEKHTIIQAVHRQLAHYSNHVGQIVFIGKMLTGNEWQSPSIPKGKSEVFNQKMFGDKDRTSR